MACGIPRFARIDDRRPHLQRKSAVCGINGFLPRLATRSGHLPFISSTRLAKLAALALRPLSAGQLRLAFASKRKNMPQQFFSFESELQNNNQAPSSHCSSVQERLVTYGSEALDSSEHLGVILNSQKDANALLKHFGSLAVLAQASVEQLLPFVSRSKAIRLVSSLRMGAVTLREERQSITIDRRLSHTHQ